MKYTKCWLLAKLLENKQFGYFGFWGSRGESREEKVFSNFFYSPFEMKLANIPDGVRLTPQGTFIFDCNEQYFMYRKAVEFEDTEVMKQILQSGLKPMDYKRLGRQVKNYNDKKWGAVRYDAMLEGLRAKFSQNEELKRILLSTGDKVLVEASPKDTIWGVGFSKSSPSWKDPTNWRGSNLLGFALMELRDELVEKALVSGGLL